MQDLIHIIRQQLVLCLRLYELTREQQNALVNTAAPAVQRLTKEIEAVVIDLNRLEKKRRDFLQQQGSRDAASWVAVQPEGLEKNMALQLLEKLKEASGNNLQYLNKNIEYIDYNVNVMTCTAAGVTYGTPGDNGGMPVQGSKMFEANV